jgi:hypothetical protein
MALVVLAVVFRISEEMKVGMFRRFLNILKIAFLFPVFGRTIVALDFAYGILQWYGVQVSYVQLLTNFVTSTFLAAAFLVLCYDWSREPIAGEGSLGSFER